MIVSTTNPILYNDSFSNAEGDPKIYDAMNQRQVQAFQNWLNVKYPKWYIGTTLPSSSKKFGDKTDLTTQSAWKLYGDDWYQEAMGITKTIQDTILKPIESSKITEERKVTTKRKPTSITTQEVDPKKGMSTTTKILIGVGAAAVLGTIIYLIVRKK